MSPKNFAGMAGARRYEADIPSGTAFGRALIKVSVPPQTRIQADKGEPKWTQVTEFIAWIIIGVHRGLAYRKDS